MAAEIQVKYYSFFMNSEHRNDLVNLFIQFQEEFQYTKKVNFNLTEHFTNEISSFRDNKTEWKDNREVTYTYYHNRIRGASLPSPSDIYSSVKRALKILVKEDLERFEALDNNDEEE